MALQRYTKVFTVFSFLRLRSPDIRLYQWFYPTLIFALIVGGYHSLGDQILTFDTGELIGDINSLMGILVGFYIAALAAVASFANENLDQVMRGRTPTLTSVRQGEQIKEPLTRRRFLAVLFGYCATLSIILYVFGVLLVHLRIAQPAEGRMQPVLTIIETVAWCAYAWIISSLLVVTLLGLHYLVERMHRA